MSFVYHHRPVFKGTLRIHNSSGVFDWHEYVLEAKDTWQESDGDIAFTMVKNNSTKTLQDYGDELGFNVISGDPLSYNNGGHNRGGTLAAYQIHCDSGDTVNDLSSLGKHSDASLDCKPLYLVVLLLLWSVHIRIKKSTRSIQRFN